MADAVLEAVAQMTQAANALPDPSDFGYKAAMSPEWAADVSSVGTEIATMIKRLARADDDDDDDEALFDRLQDAVEGLLETVDGLLADDKPATKKLPPPPPLPMKQTLAPVRVPRTIIFL